MNGSDVRKAERDVRQSTQHFERAMEQLEDSIDSKTRGFRRVVAGFNRRRSALRENPTPFVLSALTLLVGGIVWALAMRREESDSIEVDVLEGLNEPLNLD